MIEKTRIYKVRRFYNMLNSVNPVDSIMINTESDRNTGQSEKEKIIKIDANHIQLNVTTTRDNITKAVEKVNENYMAENKKLEYFYHEKTGKHVVKVVDTITHEVVNQIPAQKLLDYAEGLMEYLGLNVDQKV
jgi:uncharacterized FlaG/YvyC family protein